MMTRKNYQILSRHFKLMADEVVQPWLGETITTVIATQVSNAIQKFVDDCQEFARELNDDTPADIEENYLEAQQAEYEEMLADIERNDELAKQVTPFTAEPPPSTDHAEYDAFVANRRKKS